MGVIPPRLFDTVYLSKVAGFQVGDCARQRRLALKHEGAMLDDGLVDEMGAGVRAQR